MDKWRLTSVEYHARNTAAHATEAGFEAGKDRKTGFDVLKLAELVGLGGSGAPLINGNADIEGYPPNKGLPVDKAVGMGFLETIAKNYVCVAMSAPRSCISPGYSQKRYATPHKW